MRTTKQLLKVAAIIFIGLAVCGCIVENKEDGTTTYRGDPNKVAKIEGAVETGATITGALAVLWPPLAGVSAALTMAIGAWRKQKAKVIIEQSRTQLYYSSTSAIVSAITEHRKKHPQAWPGLKKKLEDAMATRPGIEGVVRAIRDAASDAEKS